MPVLFVSHGAPTLALDVEKGAELRAWAASMPHPRAVLAFSAHWERSPLTIGTTHPAELLYDFGGFDPALYELRYAAPGAPELAARVASLLDGPPRAEERMWDHGVWVPLVHMLPGEDVPVLELSLPSRGGTRELYRLGERLRPLRDEGVLLLASGGMVHDLARLDWSGGAVAPPEWATSFEGWAREALVERRVDALLDLEHAAPDLGLAHPTLEHILPLFVALGAATDDDSVAFPIEGFEFGSLSRTSVQFG